MAENVVVHRARGEMHVCSEAAARCALATFPPHKVTFSAQMIKTQISYVWVLK